jgi:NAD(P)-dependent dehydrogenase (short-subunit alcohol dehydrogenase family)
MYASPSPGAFAECTAVIVGGNSGVGLTPAPQLSGRSVPGLLLVGRDQERGAKARNEVRAAGRVSAGLAGGAQVEFLSADCTAPAGCRAVADSARELFAPVDRLINAASAGGVTTLMHHTPIDDVVSSSHHIARPRSP